MYAPLGLRPSLSVGLDVTREHGRHDASLLQSVEMLTVERVVAACGEGLARRARVLRHHQFVGAVLPSLVMIPVDLLQGAAVTPQFPFIVIHRLPQGLGVVEVQPVDADFVPGHKQRHLVATVLAGPEPLVMEVVAHAVGRGFEHDDRVGLEHDAAAHAAHQVVGTVHRTLLPIGYLAQVSHGDVIATHGILAA